jgi:hypothetical protein
VPSFAGCHGTSGEIVRGDIQHWCELNLTRVKEVNPHLGDRPLADQKIADAAIKFLNIAKNDPKQRPFFIGECERSLVDPCLHP